MTDGGHEPEVSLVRIASTTHGVRVIAEDRAGVDMEGDADVASDGGCLTIDRVGSGLVVRVPRRIDLVIGSTSGRITIEGAIGHVAITTDTGGVTVGDALTTDVRTESSGVEIAEVRSDCRVRTKSGRVRVERCGGTADLATKNGRIVLGAGSGPVRAQCTSGRIDITLITANDVEVETITGRINVALPAGARPYRSDDWEPPAETPQGYDCTVTARSTSGRITVGS